MKTVNKLLTGLAFALTLIIFLSACNCDVKDKEAAGAIGKVKKYRKDQMDENDIKLRSEIMNDTAALRNTIRGMLLVYVYNDAYLKNMKKSADELRKEEEKTGNDMGADDLGNYCTMVENGNGQVYQMCQMCTDIVNDTVTEFSFDVEQNIRNYANYLNKLHVRDSLMKTVIDKSDFWITENEKDDKKKDQVGKVKNIRDEILLRDLTQAIVTNNQDKINTYSDMVVYNVEYAVNSVYNVNSVDQLRDDIRPMGFENLESDVNEMNASVDNLNALELTAYNIGVNEMNNFNATGNINSFVDAIKAFNTAAQENLKSGEFLAQDNLENAGNNYESQVQMDAVGNNYNAVVYNSFVFNDKDVIESITNVLNSENMNDIVVLAFDNYSAVGTNVESQANIDAYQYASDFVVNNIENLSSSMGDYIIRSSGVNYQNIDNLQDVIVPK